MTVKEHIAGLLQQKLPTLDQETILSMLEIPPEKEMGEAFSQLTEVFLADMGATWAGVLQEPVMEEGLRLGEEAVQIAREQMPVHTSDLKVRGSEVQKMIERKCLQKKPKTNGSDDLWNKPQEKYQRNLQPEKVITVGDAMKYLLARVQSGSIPNRREALLRVMSRKLEKLKDR